MISGISAEPTEALHGLNEQARVLTGRDYLSWSQITCMQRCPQQFLYRYIEPAEPAFVVQALKFGSCFHAALETFFRARMEGLTPSGEELLAAYCQQWKADEPASPPVRFNDGWDANCLEQLAEAMLTAFLDSELAGPQGDVIAVEETLTETLCADLPDILCRVDQIVQVGKTLILRDFKTARNRWSEQKVATQSGQLLLYHRLVGQRLGEEDIQLRFGVVTKGRSPAVQDLPVPVQPDRIDSLIGIIRSVWAAIGAGSFYPTPSAMVCNSCPWRQRCPAG